MQCDWVNMNNLIKWSFKKIVKWSVLVASIEKLGIAVANIHLIIICVNLCLNYKAQIPNMNNILEEF